MIDAGTTRALERILEIMEALRGPDGCPWDARQTPESLKRFLLEETYEVLEAIDSGRPAAICEELGDLLLQIVFHARIFEERGCFDMAAVANGIADKLVRRHPHVFGPLSERNAIALDRQWERIKEQESRQNGEKASRFAGIPSSLPALLRARKVEEKAERIGLDTGETKADTKSAMNALNELESAVAMKDHKRIDETLGDLLYSLVQIASGHQVDAEQSLRRAVESRLLRYREAEKELASLAGKLEPKVEEI